MSGAEPPVRSCAGCRTRRESTLLVRITARDGRHAVDGASDGRGAWLCRGTGGELVVDERCFTAASRSGFARAWRRAVAADEVAAIRHLLRRTPACDDGGGRSDAY